MFRSLVSLGFLALQLHAVPAIGRTKASPMTAIIGTPTQVTVTASISDPSLIPGSINLLQVDPNGTTRVLGILHDDGLNGDATAGDLDFALVVTLTSPSAAQIQLQVSAAFRGMLQRVKSTQMSVAFQSADAPQKAAIALAQSLETGNRMAALSLVVPSPKNSLVINSFDQQQLNELASMLRSGVLVTSRTDLRIFRAPFVTPNGANTSVEFTMIPGENGQWLIFSW